MLDISNKIIIKKKEKNNYKKIKLSNKVLT